MKYFLVLTICLLAFTAYGTAIAGSNNTGWGVGVILAESSGISGKHWTDAKTAFDFGLAWSTGDHSGAALHADYLWHRFDLVEWDGGEVPLYYGVGARYRGREEADDQAGVRFPVGVAYMWAESAFDVFIEIVPIMDFVPDSDLEFTAAIGARYFF